MNKQVFYNGVKAYFSRPEAEFAFKKSSFDIANEFGSGTGDVCVYSGISDTTGNPIHCGVGCMIPPALYRREYEGKFADAIIEDHPRLAAFWEADYRTDDAAFLRSIQSAHDNLARSDGDISELIPALERIAESYDLIP
jgi:hypothetical protein